MSENRYITEESLIQFHGFLQQEERSAGTIEKYMRDVRNFKEWLDGQVATKELSITWKQVLLQSGRAASTINSMVAAVNSYFRFMGWSDLHLKAR